MDATELVQDIQRKKMALLIVSYIEHVWLPPMSDDENAFIQFVLYVLRKTQLSEPITIIALRYLDKLKSMNPRIQPQKGSEYRLLISALMLANKVCSPHLTLSQFTLQDVR
jgi:hypothetical protein